MNDHKEKLEEELKKVEEELTHKAPELDIDSADESEVAAGVVCPLLHT